MQHPIHPIINDKVAFDYNRARWSAILRDALAALQGRSNRLLSYEEVRAQLRIGGPIYRGVQQVPVDRIVGSVDRYEEFDRAFLPRTDTMADRWRSVNRAFYLDVSLPPVLLYQVDDVYFVVDGHNRVSVAREHKQKYIDAEVRECAVRVPVSPNLQPDDLIPLGQRVEFLERTHIDRLRPNHRIDVTVLGGYERMLEHIAVHRFFLGLDWKRDVAEDEVVLHWYDAVYGSITDVLGQSNILGWFPRRTLSDLYLWTLDHQHFLVTEGRASMKPPQQAAEEFVDLIQRDPPDEPAAPSD